jgi:hypothetical protein
MSTAITRSRRWGSPARPQSSVQSCFLQVYDNFDKPGYSLTDYAEKWFTPYGLGEMSVNDTRNFTGGYLNLGAVPFQTASDVGVI